MRVLRCSGHQCHQCLLLVTKVNHQMWSRGISVSCPWATSLQQGDVISKVIVLMAQAAEAAPLAHHEAERQHEEGADGRHDVGYGHEGRLVCLWDVVATVFHVRGDKRAFHCCRPELIVHWGKGRREWAALIAIQQFGSYNKKNFLVGLEISPRGGSKHLLPWRYEGAGQKSLAR